VKSNFKFFALSFTIVLISANLLAQTSPAPKVATTKHTTASQTIASSTPMPKNIPPVKGISHTVALPPLRYIDVVVGKGDLAVPGKVFTVNYTGWLRSTGVEFDSSIPDKDHPARKPFPFPAGFGRLMPGFEMGMEGMRVGGKRRIFIPAKLAYGAMGRPPIIPPNSDLVFDVELVSIADLPKPPAPPAARVPGAPPTPAAPTTPPAPKPPAAPAAPVAPTAPTTPAATTTAPATTTTSH
jgi:peptidylprolyl isomerase